VLCRYDANELVTHFTIEAVETRAWAPPSVDGLPLGLTGAHVFHAWLGLGRVLEVFEVRGLWARLSDRISRIHVRRIPAVMRMRPMRPLAVTFGDFLGAIPRAAPHFQSGRGRSSRFEATVRTSCSFRKPIESLRRCSSILQRYRVHFDNGHTTILAAHELLTVSRPIRTGRLASILRIWFDPVVDLFCSTAFSSPRRETPRTYRQRVRERSRS
jgi:hypothetical protein